VVSAPWRVRRDGTADLSPTLTRPWPGRPAETAASYLAKFERNGGIVEELLLNEGDPVRPGEPIALVTPE